MKRKLPIWVTITFLLVIVLVSTALIARVDTTDDIPRIRPYKGKNRFDLCTYLDVHPITSDSLLQTFPYDRFFDSVNYRNVSRLKECLNCLDTKFPADRSINRRLLTTALTDRLEARLKSYYANYRPDSLLMLLQWAERFRSYAEIETDNDLLYNAVYDYWKNVLSHNMEMFTVQNPSLKYDFKYKYIRTRLVENNTVNPKKETSTEKFLENLIYSRWGHLIGATWNQTSFWGKVGLFLFVSVWFYGIFSLFKHIKNKFRK